MTENPFELLLDTYEEESEEFYNKITKKIKYIPSTSSVGQAKHKILKSAFAYMCMEYLSEVNDDLYYDDLPLFIEDIELDDYTLEVYYLFGQENIEWEKDSISAKTLIDENLFNNLIQKYIKWWGHQMKNKYPDTTNFYALFADNIFGESNGPYGIDVASKAMEYVDGVIR